MQRHVVTTPCKINLHLGIHHETDARGYHRVDSVMVPVALFDTVTVEDLPAAADGAAQQEGPVVSFSPALEVSPEKTGVFRAVVQLAQALGVSPAVRVRVEARIPERAGLGGSSADAGATLRALAQRWGVPADDPRVVGVARSIGADVAFFLNPVPSLCLGAGDVLAQTFPSFETPVALVMPAGEGGSTPAAYAEFDRMGENPTGYDALCAALEASDVRAMSHHLANNLAPAAISLCAEVGEVEAWLRTQPGVIAAQVTGSGSCSFALCESVGAADAIARAAEKNPGWRAWSTKTVGLSAKVC